MGGYSERSLREVRDVQKILVVGGRDLSMDRIVEVLKEQEDDATVTHVKNFDDARAVARTAGADILVADVRYSFPASEFDVEAERFSPTKGHAREDLDFIKRYIRNHYNEKINLKKIADLACLSTTYFCYLFKQVEGMTVHEYVEKLRMERAAYMLITEDRIIRDIAEEVGYPQSTYFTKLFVRHFGMKPVEYRLAHRPASSKGKRHERMKVADGR